MAFSDAIHRLNTLKRRRLIRDYVIIGAVAATAYMEPMFTEALDIVVLVDTDEEYLSVFRRIAQEAEGREGMHYVLGSVPVQMFPTTIKPLYLDALKGARRARVGEFRVKVASPEHLLLLFLEAFREKDRFRIRSLLPKVDAGYLNRLLEDFDDEGRLTRRLQTLL
jgi:hypothetical protein